MAGSYTTSIQRDSWLQKGDFSSCSQISRLNYGRAFSTVPSQGEIGRLNLNKSREHKTIWGLSLLNVEIHHYFKHLAAPSSSLLPQKLRRRVTIYSFSVKLVTQMKYKSWEVRTRVCFLSECFCSEATSRDCGALTWIAPGLLHNTAVQGFRHIEMISPKYSIVCWDLKETQLLNEMKYPLPEN